MSVDISLRSPEALVAAVPYMLGHAPSKSVITVTTERVAGRPVIGLVSRTNLADLDTIANADALQAFRESVVAAVARLGNPESTVLMIVDDAPAGPGFMHHTDVVWDLRDALEEVVPVQDVLYTDLNSYRSYLCTDLGCPCIQGAAISQEARDAVAAEFVAVGSAPMESRDAIEAEWSIDELPVDLVQAAKTLCENARVGKTPQVSWTEPADALEGYARLGQFVHEVTATQAGASLPVVQVLATAENNIRVRDALLHHVAQLSVAEGRSFADQVRQNAAVMPVNMREAAALIAAQSYYLSGDGLRANIAVDQAMSANPDSVFGQMTQTMLARGVPPQMVREMYVAMDPATVMGVDAAAAASEPPPAVPAPTAQPTL